MIARRDAKSFFIGVAVTLAGVLFVTGCLDLRRGEITRAFEEPIREARGPMGPIGAQIPGELRNVTVAIAPLFPIGSDLRYAEHRLHKEGFRIRAGAEGPLEGKSISASRACGPRSFGFQANCVVILYFDSGKITKVSAVADEPQGS